MSDLDERSKVNLYLWDLLGHCLLRLNISSEQNEFGVNSFQKTPLQKFHHFNALESKFDLDS